MDRALRRFYSERAKKRARSYWRFSYHNPTETFYEPTAESLGIAATTKCTCSNYCCGNRRKYEGISIQERKQLDSFKAQLEEYEL